MSHSPELWDRKLGVFVDRTVNSNTVARLQSLAKESIVLEAQVEFPENDSQLKEIVNRLATGSFEYIIFVTSAGVSSFVQRGARYLGRRRLLDSLCDIRSVAAGDLVAARLQELGIEPAICLEDPWAWKELLVRLDRECTMANTSVALETTSDVVALAAGLEARGAEVVRIEPIVFALDDATSAEQDLLDAIEDGELGSLLFATPLCAARFVNLVNGRRLPALREHVAKLVLFALGDDTRQILIGRGIHCDWTLNESWLQSESSQSLAAIREVLESSVQNLSGPGSIAADRHAPWFQSLFMKTMRGEPTEATPVWFWRQASRYMKNYRAIRRDMSYRELCLDAGRCSELACIAVQHLNVDAGVAVIDPWLPLESMGFQLNYEFWPGPSLQPVLIKGTDVDLVVALESEQTSWPFIDTVRRTRLEMPDDVPLIGLSAAPFTLASRMIEGQPTRNFARTKYFMSQYPSAWLELMSKISLSIITLSRNQLEAGAQCLQLLDVPSGCLGTNQYRDLVWPFVRRVLEELLPLAPVVHCVGVSALMMGPSIAMGQGFSVDWRTPLDFVSQLLGPTVLQGNLDPAALLMNPRGIESQVRYVLNAVRGQKGHVFNVGSSILPPTPPAHVAAAVDMVHQLSRR